MEQIKELRLAVLIDADNIPYANVKGMMEEIAKYGTPTFKRIYGDWTKPTLTGWKSVLLQIFSIQEELTDFVSSQVTVILQDLQQDCAKQECRSME